MPRRIPVADAEFFAFPRNVDEIVIVKDRTESEIWRLSNLQLQATLPELKVGQFSHACTVSKTGDILAIVGSAGVIGLRQIPERRVISEFEIPDSNDSQAVAAAFLDDDRSLAVLQILGRPTFEFRPQFPFFTPVTIYDRHMLSLFELPSFDLKKSFRHHGCPRQLFTIPGKNAILVPDWDAARIWNFESSK